ncbi:DNA (cytosine-5-)-methyltransferase (plasmid) [Listeria monocytogenes]|uniref:Cytosine-specific methyltransferase n=1 Tax=Listeria monocytogenes TaxID=1639 RepID=A0A823J8A8_LISMN|nr:DNA (cytosine-5-)-methyltransferase [Listeria monocytogenes]EAE5923253.1 DNA (cytosine-5-)-methyltransferase [Listeria monocytogenes]EAG6688880.1 DNA (cytosine-5-)-methyltransferase [Listeria monocytogenes]EAG9355016.1 DNA (cytosine-5-)-methyltransferase [Listeria monocytogenes]QOF63866.1 DNA (cytosine-5-)-methyltransferase [Listeria monocytogenes FSL J1-208]UIJ56453.1 DNA (cytosine-5-)-methyltransferase [Listeria monocytogenes]
MSNERKVEKTFVDLFAGVGGFRLGMEAAGHKCVGYVEIDKYARTSYTAIHQTEGEFEGHDITSISDDVIRSIGRVDIITGGFPCQAFSIAGKRRGFEDTRGTLFFEIMRWATVLEPETLFLENVPGLLSHDEGITFETILRKMDEAGYDAEWDCLNACHFGVPQSRERIFLVGHSRKGRRRKVFPIERCNEQANLERIKKINRINNHSQVLFSKSEEAFSFVQKTTCIPILSPEREEKRQNGRRFKTQGEPAFTITAQDRHGIIVSGELEGTGREQSNRVYSEKGLAPTLTTMQGGGQEPKVLLVREATKKGYAEAVKYDGINLSMPESETRRGRVAKQMTSTLDTGCQQGVVVEEMRIRKLTPLECWRLQGFPDWAFAAAAKVNSNSQLYKQAGNSVAVPVIVAIAENL